ncbi:MAG: Nif3-like dinuclear metal center hexameric protein [Candidatus Marinimicrobia bacterium]|nr:Nif3-like dinuclear metal center hexameric protein [Candidatus Neomarinimicrobiota bacterium]
MNADEGVQHGLANRELRGVTVAWMASPDAIRAAGEAGHELLIAHESLYYPYDVLQMPQPPADWRDWAVNQRRRSLLDQYRLSVLRLHGSVDEICIFTTFADRLGLGTPVYDQGFIKIYEIPACQLGALVERVKSRMGMPYVRVAAGGDLTRTVSRIGLPWGGMGLFVNVAYMQQLVAQHCDVFIAGESDNYGFRFAVESGIPMIETSHELSENPGLRHFVAGLAARFPGVRFSFYENDCVWHVA